MFCIACGKPARDDARFCGKCGAELFVPPPSEIIVSPPPVLLTPEAPVCIDASIPKRQREDSPALAGKAYREGVTGFEGTTPLSMPGKTKGLRWKVVAVFAVAVAAGAVLLLVTRRHATPSPSTNAKASSAHEVLQSKGDSPDEAPAGRTWVPAPPTAQPVPITQSAPVLGDVPASVSASPSARLEPTVPTISGRWLVVVRITQTTYTPFLGLTAEYEVTISQTGDTFAGRGVKVAENGRSIPEGSRDAIAIDGHLTSSRVTATYVLHGKRRDSTGGFEWVLSPDDERLDGSFFGDRSETRGTSWATRRP